MKTFRIRTVSAFALAALVAALHIAPANAMGRSGSPTSTPEPQAKEPSSQTGAETQVQIEALRKELAELKAQLTMGKVAATAE
jgi:hypothetical protein